MPNYIQPDYRNPVTPVDSSGHALGTISVQVENTQAPGCVLGNPLGLTVLLLADYIQAGTSANGVEILRTPLTAAQLGGALTLGASKITRADGTTAST